MAKWQLKNPEFKIVLSKGSGELTASTITDEIVEELIKTNPNYESQFVKVEEVKPAVKGKAE
jgi:hypothetical protein